MAGKARISAASARAHTRNSTRTNGFCQCCCGIPGKIVLALLTLTLAWFYKSLQPPSPKLCGTPFGLAVTASRVQLKDGRFIAYEERGMPKDQAKFKVIMVHGFCGSRKDFLPAPQSLVENLGIYFLGFDRAGYGQSDPNLGRTIKSEAFDIQELADILELGPKFYVIATSIGGYSAWACLKYIPHRLAGVAMLAPVTNYWWAGIPFSESFAAYRLQPLQDQIAVGIAHYAPWLVYWWNTQKIFPRLSVIENRMDYLNSMDLEIIWNVFQKEPREAAVQQGVYESLHQDMINMFGSWEFSPRDLKDPFEGKVAVHIWHGDEDFLVPVLLQRWVHRELPWINYHEVSGAGHFLPGVPGLPEKVLKSLLS